MRPILTILILLFCNDALAKERYTYGVGSGAGANYAFYPGVNFSYTQNKLSVIGSLGIENHYAMGIQYSFRDQYKTWQPRIIINYGTNGDLATLERSTVVKEAGYPDTYQGVTVLLGSRIAFGDKAQHGLELDIGYKLTDGGFENDQDRFDEEYPDTPTDNTLPLFSIVQLFGGTTDIQISVGWKFHF